MVAKNEETARRNRDLRIGAGIGVVGGDIVFFDRIAIHVDGSIVDADAVTGDADDALDVALGRVAGIAEHDDVSAGDRLPTIDELIDEDALLIFQTGHHAGAFDLHRLIKEDDDESRNGERNQQVAHPDGDYGQVT